MIIETIAVATLTLWLSAAAIRKRRETVVQKVEEMQVIADRMNALLAEDRAESLGRLLQHPEALGAIDTEPIHREIKRLKQTGKV